MSLFSHPPPPPQADYFAASLKQPTRTPISHTQPRRRPFFMFHRKKIEATTPELPHFPNLSGYPYLPSPHRRGWAVLAALSPPRALNPSPSCLVKDFVVTIAVSLLHHQCFLFYGIIPNSIKTCQNTSQLSESFSLGTILPCCYLRISSAPSKKTH